MHIVSIAPYIPSSSMPYAGGQWYYHYLARLGEQHNVTLVAPRTTDNEARIGGAPSGVEVIACRPRGRSLPARACWKIGANRLVLGMRAILPRLEDAAYALGEADVIELQWSETLSLLPAVRRAAPRAPVAAVEHDIFFRAIASAGWERLSAPAIRRQELRWLKQVDAVLAFKRADLDLLRSLGVLPKVTDVFTPWLQLPPRAAVAARREAERLLFVAAWDRETNIAGAMWFLDRVWPRVLEAAPTAQVVFAGGSPPQKLVERADASVVVTGYLPDLGDEYARARAAIAPLFGEGGLKFKIPQAMAFGLPVVSTVAASAGLEAAPSGALLIADEPPAFARHVIDVLRRPWDPVHAMRLRDWVEAEFHPDRSAAAAEACFSALLGSRP